MRRLVVPGFALTALAGCIFLTQFDPEGQPCDPNAQCLTDAGYWCVAGACRKGPPPELDAGDDSGFDAGTDSGVDAGSDGGLDSGPDAGKKDAGADAGKADSGCDGGNPDAAGGC